MNHIYNVKTFQLKQGNYIARAYVGDEPAIIGAVKYGDTAEEAKGKLEYLLKSKGKLVAR